MQTNDIIAALNKYGITNKLEQAFFLGQADHESSGFTKFSEGTNFRYSTARLTWPGRVSLINAKQKELNAKDNDFCPQPWLFDMCYGGRMGNDASNNDGFNYRGGGIGQLTGKANYLALLNWLHKQGQVLNLTIDTIDEWVRTPDGAVISFIWFWLSKNIGKDARDGNITKVTVAINGGTIGINERLKLTNKYKLLLGVK